MILSFGLLLFHAVLCAEITCPRLQCEEFTAEADDLQAMAEMWCFSIDDNLPMQVIRGRNCDYTVDNQVLSGKAVCDFDLETHDFSWINEPTQYLSSSASEPADELTRENS